MYMCLLDKQLDHVYSATMNLSMASLFLMTVGKSKMAAKSKMATIALIDVSLQILDIYRGYYTVARRYEFYVRVANTISHE